MQETFDTQKVEEEIIKSYRTFIDYYTHRRDLEGVLDMFSPNITNIGSGEDELTLDYDSVVAVFKRDIDQCPCPLSYKEKHLKVMAFNRDQGIVISSFDADTVIQNMPVCMQGYRFSILWQRTSGKWLISHIHLSKGEPSLKEGESFPLSEVEEKNKTLEKLVNKRTRELCKLNIELSDANKEISEIKQRFETIFEKASDGIIVSDWENNSFFMINQRMCEILGYKKSKLEGMWIKDLIPKEDLHESMQKILQESSGNRIIADDIPFVCSNKEIRYFDITSQPIKIKRKNYLVSLYRDITEHKRTLLLKQKAEIAQKASEAKNLFLANMSHEIRTPVTGIMGMSEILAKTELNTQQTEYLRIINDSSKILLALINDILDISKIESGKMEMKQEHFRLEDLIDNIRTLTEPGVLNKNITIKVNISSGLPEWITTDKLRVEQILMNLINNAIKFSENGTITLDVESMNEEDENLVKISVTDTGIGISKEDQAKLFQKYQQVNTSLSRPADGSGLGLFICKQLVALLGGNIGVKSAPGQGSTFWFTFTYHESVHKPLPLPDDAFETDMPLGLKVLLVDDKKVNLQVISLMLQTVMCETETACNGLEALEKFDPRRHEVVLMDIMMPLMDGITAMKELRKKHEKLPPIIAITANAMTGDKEKYLREGFDGYINKPLTINKLTSELLKLEIL